MGFLDEIQKGVTLKKTDTDDNEKPNTNLPKKPMSFLDEIQQGVKLKKAEERDVKQNVLPKKPMTFLDEIKQGVTLKKSVLNPPSFQPEEKNESKFKKPVEITSQNVNKVLMNAIQMRGYQLNKNNVDDDESEGSDSWSD